MWMLEVTEFTQCYPYGHGFRTIYCYLGSILMTISLKKINFSSRHQMSIFPQPSMGLHDSLPHSCWDFAWAHVFRSYAFGYSCYVSKRTVISNRYCVISNHYLWLLCSLGPHLLHDTVNLDIFLFKLKIELIKLFSILG